ncbi:ATP-grasp fold amidoligase family protein [Neobacillus drentensis]|uniref:ATP-grasp fold amidoligase family protein n=1 Tax=Neobacillus drentensis TaxID=220684 RepID=UPI00300332D9
MSIVLKKVFTRFLKGIANPQLILMFLAARGFLKWLPDKQYLKLMFIIRIKQKLNLNKPRTFNEKLQWLKLNDQRSEYTTYVDKFEVRKFIENTIGGQYLIPILGVYDNFDEIDFEALPDKFVLKCTHDSGGLVICTDKSNLNIKEAKDKLNKCLSRNYYYVHREYPYKNVKPRIICEKYMVDESDTDLKDYKFMCFNGKVKCSFVCLNRNSPHGLNIDFYDLYWNIMPFERYYPKSGTTINKPINYDKMIELAEILSKDIPFVRIDFYEVDGKLYFGELTLYPGSGFEEFTPKSFDELLGSWINLPILK